MADVVDRTVLETILEVNLKKYERSMAKYANRTEVAAHKAEKAFSGSTRRMTKNANKMSGNLLRALAPVIAAFGSGALIKGALSTAREIENLSLIAGVSAERFQELDFAAGKFGIKQDKLSDILKDVNDKFGDFMQTGGGPLLDFFEQIAPKVGLTADSFRGLSSDQALGLYIKALEDANVNQQDMTFFMEALANDGTALIPVFRNGGKELKKFSKEARDMGRVLDNDAVAKAVEADRKLQQLGDTIRVGLTGAVIDAAPEIISLTETLIELAPKFIGWAKGAVEGIADIVEGLESLKSLIKTGSLDMGSVGDSFDFAIAQDELGKLVKKRDEVQKKLDKLGEKKVTPAGMRRFNALTNDLADLDAKIRGTKSELDRLNELPVSQPSRDSGAIVDNVSGNQPKFRSSTQKDRDASLRAIDEIKAAYRDLYETERQEIERTTAERMKALDELEAKGIDVAQSRVEAEKVRAGLLKELDDEDAERLKETLDEAAAAVAEKVTLEKEAVNEILASRDYLLGRTMALMQREYDARKVAIETEIQDEARKNEALAALAEERAEAERLYKDQLLAQGEFSEDPGERVRAQADIEIAALQEAYDAKLISLQEFLDQRNQLELQADAVLADQRAQNQQMMLGASQSFFSAMGSLAKQRLGENSAIAKALFLAEKASAAASIIVNTEMAKMQAFAQLGPIAGAPVAAGIQAAGILSLATVAAQTVAGFERGGYTGGGGRKAIAGVVHGQEFVTHAGATSKNRNVLEAMNNGADIEGMLRDMRRPVLMQSGGTNVSIHNNAPGVQVRQQQRGPNIELIIEAAKNAVAEDILQGGGIVSGSLEGRYGVNRAGGSL